MLNPSSFFELSTFTHSSLFSDKNFVWEALSELKDYMAQYTYPELSHSLYRSGLPLVNHLLWHEGELVELGDKTIEWGDVCKGKLRVYDGEKELVGASVLMAGATFMGDSISIGKGCLIESGAMIKGRTIVGDNCEVRQGAYLRGDTLTGDRCVLGHSTEIKHSILLNDAKAGHFNYLGDSILGNNTNLGAGTKFANLRFLPGNVFISAEKQRIDSGLRKFGAILGDNSQTGCNAVTSPGTVLSKRCILMPNTTAPSGYFPKGSRI